MMATKILTYLVIGAVALVAYVRFIEATTIFLPTKFITANPRDIGLSYEDVHFAAEDNVRLHGWFIPAPGAGSTILFLHGNAGNLGDRLEKIEMFHRIGLNVFIVDYRGYGLSDGRPSERGIYRDAAAAYDYLIARKDLGNPRIVAYGVSLGGTAAVDLAQNRPVDALILEATFTSAADMARKIVPVIPPFFLSVRFDNITKIKAVKAPKLFIHSETDEIVPFAYGKRLYDAAEIPKAFIKIAGTHNEGFRTSQDFYVDGIKDFLMKNNLVNP